MSPIIEPPGSVVLLVGREQFTPPGTFGGRTCVATADCVAVGVLSVDDGPTRVSFAEDAGSSGLETLGSFLIESEGLLSVRDVYNREHDCCGVEAGQVRVTVLGDDASEPNDVTFLVAPA